MAKPPVQEPLEPGPVFGYGYQPAPPEHPGGGRRAAAIIVPALLIGLLAAAGAVMLLGVVKFGAPSMTGITMASRVDRSNRPMTATATFSVDDDSIYCCATAHAFAGTRLQARWFHQGEVIAQYTGRFGSMAQAPAAKFLAATARVAFKLSRPEEGWATGSYSVRLAVDGKEAGSRSFTVSKSPEGAAGTRYDDPGGGFSVLVPAGWLPGDKATLGAALAGFIAPSGPYPPRYAVSLTDFTSVEPGYLNGILRQAGAKQGELFAAYSVGEMVGARRTFEWDYKSGEEQYRVKTIQVVLQSEGKVYSIDCHSLAMDYQSNEPTFNNVISSFR